VAPNWADPSGIIVSSTAERRDRRSCTHHSSRREQQAPSRDLATLHAHQRQRHGRHRDSDLA
jgi:hypothetical protein